MWTDRLLFAPPGYTSIGGFDAGIVRDDAGNLLLRGGCPTGCPAQPGNLDVVTVGPDSFSVKGSVILNSTKATAGHPPGETEGMIYINTFDNAIKMFADGDWRTLVSW